MSIISINTKYIKKFISETELESIQSQIDCCHNILHSKSGLGNEYLGWLTLPETHSTDEINLILETAEKIKANSDILIVIGIGGSYLGARSAIELLKSNNYNLIKKDTPQIYFLGNNISGNQINEIMELCSEKNVSLNVISKSGTTLEPAIAFRILKKFMEQKYGENAKNRIYVTTDSHSGALNQICKKNNYQTFVIPNDIGGRYSVLTPVGLLPMAVAGINIKKVFEGAKLAQKELNENNIINNPCYKYSAIRNLMYSKHKKIELFVSYEPYIQSFNEWLKQLFGESEGKNKKGLFPSSATFTTDLHSIGQFLQQGSPILFETIIYSNMTISDITIEPEEDDIDSLNYLQGRRLSSINKIAMMGTAKAHSDENTPVIIIEIDKIDEVNYGYLVYFFEKACAISSYLLNINPFDQPGVENYKNNIFKMLGK